MVDMSKDCHLSFESLGGSAPIESLHYVQPRCLPALYPSELTSHTASKSLAGPRPLTNLPAIIKEDASDSDNDGVTWSYPQPKCPAPLPRMSFPPLNLFANAADLASMSAQLHLLVKSITELQPSATPLFLATTPPGKPCSSPVLVSAISREEIILRLHQDGSTLPAIRPCNMANKSDTKTHWTEEELHRAMGCQMFKNYKTLLQVSRDGKQIDGGEFPPLLGSFATIPKAKRSKALTKQNYFYLDVVHMDIAFGNCLFVGGFKYTLILVDRATRYNWTFGLKWLSSESILLMLHLFCASAGGLAHCFYCDCDTKLFGMAISEYLIDSNSKVVVAPAKHQSSNGLVESHWKTMVHMARGYLTAKQMPHNF
jgi:hypothetical protein